jgi:hypothetical protein
LFRDEIENLIGIRKHEDIIKYIIEEGGEGWYYHMIVSPFVCS